MNKNLKHLETNTAGRDFVVGDLHGCFDQLQLLLDHVKFDKAVDRLISVGDLTDRGPKSLECAQLLDEPWFHSVKGNHEELMYGSVLNESGNFDGWITSTWIGNGGAWFANHDLEEIKRLARKMVDLPLVITVGEGADRFNVVHGELYYDMPVDNGMPSSLHDALGWGKHRQRVPLTDELIDKWVFDSHGEQQMLWGRSIIQGTKAVAYKWHDSEKMSLTFVGHTPVRAVVQYGQQVYIDGGGVFSVMGQISHDNALILAEPKADKYYRYGVVVGNISEHNISTVEKWAQ